MGGNRLFWSGFTQQINLQYDFLTLFGKTPHAAHQIGQGAELVLNILIIFALNNIDLVFHSDKIPQLFNIHASIFNFVFYLSWGSELEYGTSM